MKIITQHINYLLLTVLFMGNAPLVAYEMPECTLKGMVGTQPNEVCTIIETLKEFQTKQQEDELNEMDEELQSSSEEEEEEEEEVELLFKNRVLLHGPAGTGKSTIGRKIAELTNRKLIERSGAQIVGRYQNQGAETVDIMFDQAIELIKSGESVVVFIDEIDILATSNSAEQLREYAAAASELWTQLDKHKNNGNLLFVCTTNRFKSLSAPFRGRFGDNIIEVGKPNTQNRKLLLERFFSKVNISLNEDQVDDLTSLSEGLDPRGIEDLAIGSHALLSRLKKAHGGQAEISITQIKDMLKRIKENHADDEESLEEKQKEDLRYRKAQRQEEERLRKANLDEIKYQKRQRAANESARDWNKRAAILGIVAALGGTALGYAIAIFVPPAAIAAGGAVVVGKAIEAAT